jgi:hypothetical protein
MIETYSGTRSISYYTKSLAFCVSTDSSEPSSYFAYRNSDTSSGTVLATSGSVIYRSSGSWYSGSSYVPSYTPAYDGASLGGGAISGIVIGSVVAVVIFLVVARYCVKKVTSSSQAPVLNQPLQPQTQSQQAPYAPQPAYAAQSPYAPSPAGYGPPAPFGAPTPGYGTPAPYVAPPQAAYSYNFVSPSISPYDAQ